MSGVGEIMIMIIIIITNGNKMKYNESVQNASP